MSLTLAPGHQVRSEFSDDELLVQAGEGDRAAFTLFYERTAPRVLGLVTRVLVDPAQAEEVTQEVFLAVWQQATRFDPRRGRASSWLLTTAHRRAVDRVRSSQASHDRDLAVGTRDHHEVRDDVAETAEISVRHQAVTRILSSLTPAHQQALELTYFSGLTNTEAAQRAGVPVGTMKTRIRDALITLRRNLPLETGVAAA